MQNANSVPCSYWLLAFGKKGTEAQRQKAKS